MPYPSRRYYDHGQSSLFDKEFPPPMSASATDRSDAMAEPAAPPILNVAAYQFAPLDNLTLRRRELKDLCRDLDLRGTILLSPEGINLFLAGEDAAVGHLLADLRRDPLLQQLDVKFSRSAEQPFRRLLVKIKPEIIAFGQPGIDPVNRPTPRVAPAELKAWLDAGDDVVLLDVRNNYELEVGAFTDAIPIDVEHFREFPEAVRRLPESWRDRKIVTYCTGGIRCEKAGPFLEQAGFQHVFQLHGGILRYFEEVGGAHYRGGCFVFDQRVAVDPQLQQTGDALCFACLAAVSVADQASPLYDPPRSCPRCHRSDDERLQNALSRRTALLQKFIAPLPGSLPRDNARPFNIPARADGLTLVDALTLVLRGREKSKWQSLLDAGRVREHDQPQPADRVVRAGEQFTIVDLAQIEPNVNARIEFLFEDAALVVVNKPAPLPMHPCGRFHRNSLQWILQHVYAPERLRPAHRLDANTTGVAILCRTRAASRQLQPQFERGEVTKRYLARIAGQPDWQTLTVDAAISRTPGACGGRTVEEDGLPARTHFRVLQRNGDGTALVEATPETGRTNQIRLHLWRIGHPVCGDPLYRPGGVLGEEQTMTCEEVMCLHALELTVRHPLTGESVTFQAPPPIWSGLLQKQSR